MLALLILRVPKTQQQISTRVHLRQGLEGRKQPNQHVPEGNVVEGLHANSVKAVRASPARWSAREAGPERDGIQ